MIVLQEKNGRTIQSIKFNKKDISLYFEDGEVLKLSESTYTHFYLYKDKVLSNEELEEILEYESLNKARNYALNLLSKSYYTEKEILSRLIEKKKIKKENASNIIEYLKEHGFVNDKRFLEEFVESLHHKNYGKNKIIQKCYDEGFIKEDIESLVFDFEEEKLKAENALRKYISNKTSNYMKLKENSYSFLINHGFDYEISSLTIKIIDDEYDFSKEKEILHKEIYKYILSKRIDINDYEEKQKLISSFIKKGYKYDDIKSELEGVEQNEIY